MAEEKDKQTRENIPSQISRREFLKDAGLVVGGATIGSMAIMSACGGSDTTSTKTVTSTVTKTATSNSTATVTVTAPASTTTQSGTLLKEITFNMNGFPTTVAVDPGWDLKYLLHDKLGYIGVKDMCGGYGACGSCTVIVNGKAVLSCMTLAIECDGKTIENSEGIASAKHPLVEAFIMNNCFQCGYCTPGFLVSAKALLDKNPKPTTDEIKQALSGNLCRCTMYPQLVPAVNAAAAELGGTE
jgi:aerobic-type carbon monoxide dehydrogenase small subunit (CoxS/CutS family)